MSLGVSIQPSEGIGPLRVLDARAKALAFASYIVCVVTIPREASHLLAGYGLLLLLLVAAARVPPVQLVKRSAVVLPLAAMVAVAAPFMALGGNGLDRQFTGVFNPTPETWTFVLNVAGKAVLSAMALILLTATTGFDRLLSALEQIHVPRIFIRLLATTYRFLFVILDEAVRMKRSADSRGYGGRWLGHAHVIGRMVGSLFLRSVERAERVHNAMLARGYDGHPQRTTGTSLRAADIAFASLMILLTVSMRLFA